MACHWRFRSLLGAMVLISLATTLPARGQIDFVRGDRNCDGVVDAGDTLLVTTCEDAQDLNDDGVINILDFAYLANFIGGGGSAPPPPYPDCGPDPTPDGLNCDVDCCPAAGVCGDWGGDGLVTVLDIADAFNYCFWAGDPPLVFTDGDCDDYDTINVRDAALLVEHVFLATLNPVCPATNPEIQPLERSTDTLQIPADTIGPSVTSGVIDILYKNTTNIRAFALPLQLRLGGAIPTIDTVMWDMSADAFNVQAASVDTPNGTLNIGAVSFGTGLPPGSRTLLSIVFTVAPEPVARAIQIDTLRLAPSNSPLFLEPTTLAGHVPTMVNLLPPEPPLEPVPHDLTFFLFSPVDMVVTDPAGDSIGIDSATGAIFNTIGAGSTYDTLIDVNADNDSDDVVTIPRPWEGDYQVRIFRETDAPDSAKFTMSIRINGNQMESPEGYEDQFVSALGTTISPTYDYSATQTLRGDVNADGVFTSADIIYLVNYVFKGGDPPVIPDHGDVNCNLATTSADVIYLVNFIFKGDDPPCS